MYFRGRTYYVYIMTNRSKTLYTGITSNLEKLEHKHHTYPGFTSRYRVGSLVYFERFGSVRAAIVWEKRIKGLMRIKKIALIVAMNPEWKDLSEEWFVGYRFQPDFIGRNA